MIHHVLHAQIQDYDHVYFGVPLRQLHTSLLLGRAWAGRLDEEEVIGRFTAARLQAPLLGHLDLVRRIFHEEPMERLSIPRKTRAHTTVSLGSFALRWPTDLARNIRWSFDMEYLTARYGAAHRRGQRPWLLMRHLATIAGQSREVVLRKATARRR